MPGFSEASTVQAWLVEQLQGLGWSSVPGRELRARPSFVQVRACFRASR